MDKSMFLSFNCNSWSIINIFMKIKYAEIESVKRKADVKPQKYLH